MKLKYHLKNHQVSDKTILLFVVLVSLSLTYIIYFDSIFYGESNYDDHVYFKYFDSLRDSGTIWPSILTDYVLANWHPVTVLSLGLDYFISQGNTVHFHLVNILIHIFNSIIVYLIFYSLSKNHFASILTAVLFIIHPLNVESVVWISERKGLLSAFFALLSVYYYIKYKNESFVRFKIIPVALFALSLLSKPTTASLPFVLVLLDVLLLNKSNKVDFYSLYCSLKDKLYYFFVIMIVIYFAFEAQSDGEALRDINKVGVISRVETSINNIFTYISKIFLPINLATFYPHPQKSIYIILLYLIIVISWVYLILKFTHKSKIIIFCLLFFFIQILPMSGVFQTGGHSVANRYTYLPAISLFFIVSFFIYSIKNRNARYSLVITVILSLSLLSMSQVKIWKNDLSMWENSVKNTEKNYYSAYYYCSQLISAGRINDCGRFFYNVIGIKNTSFMNDAIKNVVIELMSYNHFDEAKVILEKAIKHDINNGLIYSELSVIEYFYANKRELGRKYITAVLEKIPTDIRANRIYARMLLAEKKYQAALDILYKIKNDNINNKKIKKLVIEDIEKDIRRVIKKMHSNQ